MNVRAKSEVTHLVVEMRLSEAQGVLNMFKALPVHYWTTYLTASDFYTMLKYELDRVIELENAKA
jgi:hypothetical protein